MAMQTQRVRIVLRHITGSRATQVDEIALGAHRELILGRAASAAVRFDPRRDTVVGRQHARIEPDPAGGRFRLADLGSVNGTWLNGVRLEAPAWLAPGDRLRLGEHGPELEFSLEPLPDP